MGETRRAGGIRATGGGNDLPHDVDTFGFEALEVGEGHRLAGRVFAETVTDVREDRSR
jgi:hypothetical protein